MEIETIVVKDDYHDRRHSDFGWGNGYVLVNSSHPLYGKNWDEINLDVHGGITFSELVTPHLRGIFGLRPGAEGKWCIGFDTHHGGDTLAEWTESKVREETERLKQLVITASKIV